MAELQELKDLIRELQLQVAQVQGSQHRSVNQEMQGGEDRSLKVEIPEFDGSLDPEDYLEWERRLERYFEYKETPEERQYKVARLKLVKQAALWLDDVQEERLRRNKEKIKSWQKLRKRMREKYVPYNYTSRMFDQWMALSQGTKSVEEYQREFERLTIVCGLGRDKEHKRSKFLNGLNSDLREKIQSTLGVSSYEEVVKLAVILEGQRKEKAPVFQTPNKASVPRAVQHSTPSSSGSNWRTPNQPRPFERQGGRNNEDLKKVVCFKCHGHGHRQSDCPNARAFTAREWEVINEGKVIKRAMLVAYNGDEVIEQPTVPSDAPEGVYELQEDGTMGLVEDSSSAERSSTRVLVGKQANEVPKDQCYPEDEAYDDDDDDGGRLFVVRRNFHAIPVEESHPQRENIFQTKGKIMRMVCDFVIDGGSEANCVSKDVVNKLQLNTVKHPRPYKLRWLEDDKQTPVRRQCLIKFVIGSYDDEVLCDVIPMDACHVLLGRPWQSDKKTTHNGFTNTYSFMHKGRVKELLPLPPSKAVPPKKESKGAMLASRQSIEKDLDKGCGALLMFSKEVKDGLQAKDPDLARLMEEYEDVFPDDLPPGLPPIRGIEHQIDLVPGAPIPNKPAYRCNPEETKELQRQVDDLMAKG